NGIERIDVELGYRGPVGHVEGGQMQARLDADARDPSLATLDPERIYPAVVTAVVKGDLEVAVGAHRGTMDTAQSTWSRRIKTRSLRAGDIVEVGTRKPTHSRPRSAHKKTREEQDAAGGDAEEDAPAAGTELHLAQTPQIEAA